MNNVVVPKDFSSAGKDIKLAILQARAKAAHFANAEALKLYFFVGGYISTKTRNAKWGTGAIDALSNQLQVELPGLRGFSPSSIKRMRQLYEVWSEAFEIRPLLMGEMDVRCSFASGRTRTDLVSAFMAQQHAETEFEKYRIIQDRLFMSDYDRYLLELEAHAKSTKDDE